MGELGIQGVIRLRVLVYGIQGMLSCRYDNKPRGGHAFHSRFEYEV